MVNKKYRVLKSKINDLKFEIIRSEKSSEFDWALDRIEKLDKYTEDIKHSKRGNFEPTISTEYETILLNLNEVEKALKRIKKEAGEI